MKEKMVDVVGVPFKRGQFIVYAHNKGSTGGLRFGVILNLSQRAEGWNPAYKKDVLWTFTSEEGCCGRAVYLEWYDRAMVIPEDKVPAVDRKLMKEALNNPKYK